ncbi:pyrroline-5-carboxylate reductase [Alkalicoccus chagannorensis]|uniref:pyrroline-5-carboxylate reductase n=1 Tax=Alkalicoccus chagannorensis TaxID=427072 RepID=UPI0003F939D8|nr:pyrroline-5-carboxylate reductase [Alkalicoccus chagannorensis]
MNLFIIGAGSMAQALIGAWHQGSHHITVTNHSNDERLQQMQERFDVSTSRSTSRAAEADVIILSCKPKDWEEAAGRYISVVKPGTLVISVMAGVTIESMKHAVPQAHIVRAMPNTSAAVRASMTSLAFDKDITEDQQKQVLALFEEAGETAVLEESLMDAATALTGTGPAYIYYLMESMEMAAANIGIPEEIGRKLVAQTLIGASRRVQEEETTPKELYEQIMSPGGTTEAGFHVLQEEHVQEALISCIARAHERSQELGRSGITPGAAAETSMQGESLKRTT